MFFDLTVAKSPCQLLSSPSPAFNLQVLCLWGFPGGSVVKKKKKKKKKKKTTYQRRRHEIDSWVGKIPWRRK